MYNKFINYIQRSFNVSILIISISGRRKWKQKDDDVILTAIVTSLSVGATSIIEMSKSFAYNNPGKKLSRSVIENLLQQPILPYTLRKYLKYMLKRLKKGKMISLDNVMGKTIGSVDGIEINRKKLSPEAFIKAVTSGQVHKYSQVAVYRDSKTNAISHYEVYLRLVIICIITKRGPMPIAWQFQESDGFNKYRVWIEKGQSAKDHPHEALSTDAQIKQTGELTALKQLLEGLIQDNTKLPFDILVGDGLYDKSTVIDLVERYGSTLIAIHKSESRNLKQEAMEDFNTRRPSKVWSENKTSYEGWSKVYQDSNRSSTNKNVKILRVLRREEGKEEVDNYFYCSNRHWITPRLVEWCRHYRWIEENGFNQWTNKWKIMKHIFHNHPTALDSIIGLMFVVLIGTENFRKGNLKRGKNPWKSNLTLKEYFRRLYVGYISTNIFLIVKFFTTVEGPLIL